MKKAATNASEAAGHANHATDMTGVSVWTAVILAENAGCGDCTRPHSSSSSELGSSSSSDLIAGLTDPVGLWSINDLFG
jgi:hypothetical protein